MTAATPRQGYLFAPGFPYSSVGFFSMMGASCGARADLRGGAALSANLAKRVVGPTPGHRIRCATTPRQPERHQQPGDSPSSATRAGVLPQDLVDGFAAREFIGKLCPGAAEELDDGGVVAAKCQRRRGGELSKLRHQKGIQRLDPFETRIIGEKGGGSRGNRSDGVDRVGQLEARAGAETCRVDQGVARHRKDAQRGGGLDHPTVVVLPAPRPKSARRLPLVTRRGQTARTRRGVLFRCRGIPRPRK